MFLSLTDTVALEVLMVSFLHEMGRLARDSQLAGWNFMLKGLRRTGNLSPRQLVLASTQEFLRPSLTPTDILFFPFDLCGCLDLNEVHRCPW